MKNIARTTALTLIELIFAATLVSVVLLGLFSITTVLSTNSQDYGQKYLLASQTQATLNHILGNASLAVRDNIFSNDPGIITSTTPPGNILGDPNSFCIHQDISSLAPANNTPNNPATPNDYTDDRWLCYTLSNYQIYYCAMAYCSGHPPCASPWGAASCAPATSVFLGTAFKITNVSYAYPTFAISIQNCLNDATPPGTCSVLGTSLDPANNPEVVRSGSVATPQVGT